MARIKVVHVINFEIGLMVHARNYFAYLQQQGYDLRVVCPPGNYVRGDMVTPDGIHVKALPFPAKYTPAVDFSTLIKLARYFRAERFDVVHTHTVKPGLLGRIAGRMAGVPVVIHTVHGFHIWDDMTRFEQWLFLQLERFAAHFCDLMLSQNAEDIELAIHDGICPPDRIEYLGNGIDISYFHPDRVQPSQAQAIRRELGVSDAEHLVGMIGRLVRLKGYYDYLAAARLLAQQDKSIRFLAIGPTMPEKADALSPNELIAEYGLQDRMQYLGLRDDIRELLGAMDLLVLPSYSEGIPRVLMEAAAMGRAAVGTDVRGTREVIVNGETGLLVPPRDPESLAQAIHRLLTDKSLAERMGRFARDRAETHFDERHYFRRTDEAYRRLLANRRSECDTAALLALNRR